MVPQVTTIKTVKQMEDLVDLGDGAAWYEKWRIKLTTLFHQVGARYKHTNKTLSFLTFQFLVCVQPNSFDVNLAPVLFGCLFAC